MRRCLAFIGACAASLAMTAGPSLAATHTVRTLTSGGESRSTVVYRATHVSPASPPLVIVLHGGGSSGAGMENFTQFDTVAESKGFVVAYPDAVTDPTTNTKLWRVGCCNAWRKASTDVTFISDLIDKLVASDGIDRSRVYIASFSIGSAMAYRLGCELSSRVAAFGSVGGYEYLSKPCAPDRPVSVYEIHGTSDYYGGSCGGTTQTNTGCSFGQNGYLPSVPATNQQWRVFDGCGTAVAKSVAGTVTQQVWNGCAAGSSVRLDTIQNGPHCYPTTSATNCGAFNASQALWNFFAPHRLSPAPAIKTPPVGPVPPITIPLPLPVYLPATGVGHLLSAKTIPTSAAAFSLGTVHNAPTAATIQWLSYRTTVVRGGKRRAITVIAGLGATQVSAGRSRALALRLTKAGAKALRSRHRLRLDLSILAVAPDGKRGVVTKKVTLRLPAVHKR
jgi:polyhydroxybutyrate depolymerase